MSGAYFTRTAQTVADSVADLLCAPVEVLDEHGAVVASRRPATNPSASYAKNEDGSGKELLRITTQMAGRPVQVIVTEAQGVEPVPERVARVLVDMVIKQKLAKVQLEDKFDACARLLHNLLVEAAPDIARISDDAKTLGFDLDRPRSAIIIDASDFVLKAQVGGQKPVPVRLRYRAQSVINLVERFFPTYGDAMWAYIGNGEVAVLKANGTELEAWSASGEPGKNGECAGGDHNALRNAAQGLLECLNSELGAVFSIGIGRYHPGIEGLARSYADARIALSLGIPLHGDGRVHSISSLGVGAFVRISDERAKSGYARQLLLPLSSEPDLKETLQVFFEENCSLAAAVNRLYIHRNTLSYRLDKIARLLSLDPRKLDDAVQIHAALFLTEACPQTPLFPARYPVAADRSFD